MVGKVGNLADKPYDSFEFETDCSDFSGFAARQATHQKTSPESRSQETRAIIDRIRADLIGFDKVSQGALIAVLRRWPFCRRGTVFPFDPVGNDIR